MPGRQMQESPAGAGLLRLNFVVALVQKKPDDSLNHRHSHSSLYSQHEGYGLADPQSTWLG